MECCRRDCVERISVYLKRGKLLRELFSVCKSLYRKWAKKVV